MNSMEQAQGTNQFRSSWGYGRHHMSRERRTRFLSHLEGPLTAPSRENCSSERQLPRQEEGWPQAAKPHSQESFCFFKIQKSRHSFAGDLPSWLWTFQLSIGLLCRGLTMRRGYGGNGVLRLGPQREDLHRRERMLPTVRPNVEFDRAHLVRGIWPL